MTSFDALAFGRSIGLVWASAPAMEQHVDRAEMSGEIEAWPAPEVVERALVELGFTSKHARGRDLPRQAASHTIDAKKGTERVRIVMFGAVISGDGRRGRERFSLTWESGRTPRIEGSTYSWSAREWPIFLDEARLHHASSDMLIVEGKLDGTTSAFARCRDAYARWAAESAFSPHTPIEPDLAGDLALADSEFELTLTNRAPWVTVTIARR